MENENTSLAITGDSTGVARIFDTAATLPELLKVGEFIIESGFAPDHFSKQKNPAAAVVMAMQSGRELGFTMIQSLHEIVMINGLPTIKGDGAKAKVMSSGLVESWEEVREGSIGKEDLTVTITSRRKDTGEEITRDFSVAKAKRAGLWISEAAAKNNPKLKYGPWWKYPDRMVAYRALGFITRDLYPDVLKGMKTYEEVQDYNYDEYEDVTTTEKGNSKGKQMLEGATELLEQKKSTKKKPVKAKEVPVQETIDIEAEVVEEEPKDETPDAGIEENKEFDKDEGVEGTNGPNDSGLNGDPGHSEEEPKVEEEKKSTKAKPAPEKKEEVVEEKPEIKKPKGKLKKPVRNDTFFLDLHKALNIAASPVGSLLGIDFF